MAGPSSTLPAGAPTGTTSGTGLCCACPADDTILVNAAKRYYTTTFSSGYQYQSNRCHLAITRTATAGRVTITKKIKFQYTNGADPNSSEGMNIFSAAMVLMNEAARIFRIEVKQPGCDTQVLAIRFDYVPVTEGEDCTISFNGTPDPTLTVNRSVVYGGADMVFFLEAMGDQVWTMVHELMHLYGQPDEYVELPGIGTVPGPGGVVTYLPPVPDPLEVTYLGTATQGDTTIPLQHMSTSPNDPGIFIWYAQSLMGEGDNWNVFGENFFWIAKEVEYVFSFEGTPVTAKVIAG